MLSETDLLLQETLGYVDCHVTGEIIKTWTDDQKKEALNWADLSYMEFMGDDVEAPPRPEFVPEPTYD